MYQINTKYRKYKGDVDSVKFFIINVRPGQAKGFILPANPKGLFPFLPEKRSGS